MQQLKEWFKKPYPFPNFFKEKFFISLGFGKFVFIFLFLVKPLDFNRLADKSLYFAAMYGLITFVLLFLNLITLPKLFPKYFDLAKWNIGKMISFVIILILMISFANWYFSLISFKAINVDYHSLSFFLINTSITGFFPIIFYLYISERRASKKHEVMADTISNLKNGIKSNNQEVVKVVGDNKNEYFDLYLYELVYISFEKNYSSIFYIKDGGIKEKVLRISLTKIENQLSDFQFIVRCHRSYLVNTKQVKTIIGNARSYQLVLKNTSEIRIPVSRSFPKELLFTLIQ